MKNMHFGSHSSNSTLLFCSKKEIGCCKILQRCIKWERFVPEQRSDTGGFAHERRSNILTDHEFSNRTFVLISLGKSPVAQQKAVTRYLKIASI